MDNNPVQRFLTSQESNALTLLRYVEGLFETKPQRLGGSLGMTESAIAAMKRVQAGKPYRIERLSGDDYRVHFTLPELYRYVEFCCKQVGLTLNPDGSLTTRDGRTLTLEDTQ